MGNALLWLITLELLGLAALPLTAYLFRAFPDRGYGLSKIAGLLLVAFLNWWLGSIAGLGNYPIVMWLLALLLFAGGLALYRFGFAQVPGDRRALLRTIAVEEALFLIAFVVWALVRAQNPDIYATEKPMDFMLLQVSGMTHSFPPPDAWLSGHTVNYYYLGYAIFAMLCRMSGVDFPYGFNLANVSIFALGCAGAYTITLVLVRSRRWAFAGTFALMVAGDLDGLRQLISQIQNGTLNLRGLNLWCSTRVVDTPHGFNGSQVTCDNYRTITEFPIFSVIWNDLHPHLMALPFALLAIAVAVMAMLDRPGGDLPDVPAMRYLRLLLAAIVLGALFPINSWDYPTYLVLAVGAMLVAAYRNGTLSTRTAGEIVAVVPASLLAYLPYYLTVHLAGQGIAWQANPSNFVEVVTVIGALLIPAAVFAGWRCVLAVLEPDTATAEPSPVRAWLNTLPPGWGYWTFGAIILLVALLPSRTDLIFVAIVGCAAYAIIARLRRDGPETLLALGLTLLGALVLLSGDYVYLRDIFAGGPNYRMNTIFKLYYQAWLLLSFAAVYAVVTIWRALRTFQRGLSTAWAVAVACTALALLVYPIEGIPSQPASQARGTSLDGLAYLQQIDNPEYQAINWIRHNTPTDGVIAEASGTDGPSNGCGEYWVCAPTQSYNKVSALSGRPTIVGWPGSHESLWRGTSTDQSAATMLAQREQDVRTLYTTADPKQALAILHRYHVRYVYVGPVERATYVTYLKLPPAVLSKFASFLTPTFTNAEVTLYQVPGS